MQLKVLTFLHGQNAGGAQLTAIEYLYLLKEKEVEAKVVTCENTNKLILGELTNLKIDVAFTECKQSLVGTPIMYINNKVEEFIKWADIIWIADTEIFAAPSIKRIRKNVPVVAHLHIYHLLCPWMGFYYGLRKVCSGCNPMKNITCKQNMNLELSRLGILSKEKFAVYYVLDFIKGPVDYIVWKANMNKEIFNSVDGLIAPSNFVKQIHEKVLDLDIPIRVVYNPVIYQYRFVRLDSLKYDNESSTIFYASGSQPVKGPHLLLRAFKILLENGHNYVLYMSRTKGTWVEKYAEKLGIRNHVVYGGDLTYEELYRAMSNARLVVLPSLWPEPSSRIPIEANRLGVPSVLTEEGGTKEYVVENETALISKASAESLAENMMKALKIRKERSIAERSLEKINPERSVADLISYFASLT